MTSTAHALPPNLTSDDGPLAVCPEGYAVTVSRESTHSGQAERSQDPEATLSSSYVHTFNFL